MEKVFKYEETDLPIIKYRDEIWFRGKSVVEILGYVIQRKAIREHIDPEDRVRLGELRGVLESRGSKMEPLTNNQKNTIYINESGLYSLILRSKLESVQVFKRWVTKDVLPSVRKTGMYNYGIDHKYNEILTFKIENETDLHVKVASFLKKRYPHSISTATLV